MKYKDIKTFTQRCEEHPDHQTGMITYSMIEQRLHEEIDELREYIEQRTWVGLTEEEKNDCLVSADPCECLAKPESHQLMDDVEAKLREKNGG